MRRKRVRVHCLVIVDVGDTQLEHLSDRLTIYNTLL
jgi:hypothetical protein